VAAGLKDPVDRGTEPGLARSARGIAQITAFRIEEITMKVIPGRGEAASPEPMHTGLSFF
jgi:hypothetical protein